MMYVSVEYKFSDQPTSNRVEHELLRLLESLHTQGSIAGAARSLGCSYRHVWGELKHWEKKLNAHLVVWGRQSGGAVLTAEAIEFLEGMWFAQTALAQNVEAIKTSVSQNALLLKSKRLIFS